MSSNMVQDNVEEINEKLNRFWTSFCAWIDKSDVVEDFFKGDFTDYSNWNEGYFYLKIDYENEYRDYYGISYPATHECKSPSFEQVFAYLEIGFARWIKTDKRYAYTVEVNNRFEKFGLPYRMNLGKIIKKGYKTTETIGRRNRRKNRIPINGRK